jgi:uncharacterized membrane protein YphA (DoxX/SURF4 family)
MLVGRVGLGVVFLYAAYTKLQPHFTIAPPWIDVAPWISFAATIEAYKLLPEQGVIFVARTLPWFEAVLGALLVLGVGLRWVAGAASLLLMTFFGIMVRSNALGMQINCGCFGPGDALSWKTLVRDGLLAAIAVALTVAAFRAARRPAAVASESSQEHAS